MKRSSVRSSRVHGAVVLTVASLTLACAGMRQGQSDVAAEPTASPAAVDTAAPTLALQGVNVIDVADGRLLPAQTVVIAGTRIQGVGAAGQVRVPPGVQVVDGRGKYLIPGLWDVHVHVKDPGEERIAYSLLIAHGVTGFRNAGTRIALDTLRQWWQEIVAGTRVGPRQVAAGPSLKGTIRAPATPDDARHLVDSLKAAGVDFIKVRMIPGTVYLPLAARAREVGLPFGGHLPHGARGLPPADASDSGHRIVDHVYGLGACIGTSASVETCTPLAERFRRNGTWVAPTLIVENRKRPISASRPVEPRLDLTVARQANLPLLTGTDAASYRDWIQPGPSLHDELALLVYGGLTPLAALQAATLHPAQALLLADSLGTVTAGKLADLVLLEANPLADITNTRQVRAVIANGRYFDRAALDSLRAEAHRAAPRRP